MWLQSYLHKLGSKLLDSVELTHKETCINWAAQLLFVSQLVFLDFPVLDYNNEAMEINYFVLHMSPQ